MERILRMVFRLATVPPRFQHGCSDLPINQFTYLQKILELRSTAHVYDFLQ